MSILSQHDCNYVINGVWTIQRYSADVLFQVEELEAGTPGRLKVTAKSTETDEIFEGEYNTVSMEGGGCI